MFAIESRQNPAVKLARKLRQKKYRQKSGLFLMEGVRSLREVINNDYPVDTLFYSPGIKETKDMILIEVLCRKAARTFLVSDEIMDYISPADTTQKILTVLPFKKWELDDIVEKGVNFLALHMVQDPGNLGTIIRSARAFNFDGIFTIGNCVDWYNPKTVRASAGNILNLPMVSFKNTDDFIESMKIIDADIISFSPKGEELHQLPPSSNKTVFLLGGETSGLDTNLEEASCRILRIPMAKGVESLNLSMAASIVMFQRFQQKLQQSQ